MRAGTGLDTVRRTVRALVRLGAVEHVELWDGWRYRLAVCMPEQAQALMGRIGRVALFARTGSGTTSVDLRQ
ncbi:hypothetical protein [Streptomyces sp. NPDC097981]|uniref:hypothetical protein n=1 Tax=Streptomyces sp. NPDC097981 TaxID=3155428 RepID=UPI00331BF331